MGDKMPVTEGVDPATRVLRVFELEFDALKEKYTAIKALGKEFKQLLPEQQAVVAEYEKAIGIWVEPKKTGGAGDDPGKNTEATKRVDKIKKEQEDLKTFLEKNNEEIFISTLDKESREWAVIRNKSKKLRAQAHGNAPLLKENNRKEKTE